MRDAAARALSVVTDHNLAVVVLMLVVSAGVVYGVTDLRMQSDADGSNAVGDTEEFQKLEYTWQHYPNLTDGESDRDPAVVYVRAEDGNVLSRASLLDSLRYQRSVRDNASVAAALPDDGGVTGVSNVVARRLAGDPEATLDEQVAALEAASPQEVETAVEQALAPESPALELLPNDYEPGTATAESRRIVFGFVAADGDGDDGPRTAATRHLYESAGERPGYFTLGEHAWADRNEQMNRDTMELVLPVALLVILAVLAFSYRDLVDVLVGFAGVVLSVLWMFGILGWLGVPAGTTLVIGPVLVVGLSVDYGLHVFMRYREQRGDDEGVREPMLRGLSSVGVALALVTVTTAVGFLSNLANEFGMIRELAVGITLGVVSSFVVFVTLVPALKVTVDGLLERVGLDRRKRPLGKSRYLGRLLGTGATAARKAAPVVVVLALLAGTAGGLAWTDLDRQSFQSDEDGVAEWKQDLPEPLAWEVHPLDEHDGYVDAHYRAADEGSQRRSQILVEGDVTAPGALDRLAAGRASLRDSGIAFERNGEVPFVSPSSVMRSVAAGNEEFAGVLRSADTDDDGVPDRNLRAVYDALYEAAPERAALVVERTDGEYRSARMLVPISAGATYDDQAASMREAAAAVESGDRSAIAVGMATINAAESAQAANSILETLAIALVAVFAMLTVVYRLAEGSASLGAVTVVPITMVTALVVGGMYVLDIPLTLLTALLMSLVVGLGIDYNIHVSHRFAQELDAGRGVHGALREAVTGTGGALLGSTLTSTGAFAALLLHPHPQITSFGALVVLALGTSFLVSVFVLPSMLALWTRLFHDGSVGAQTAPRSDPSAGD